ncbi:VOC family protein [Nocardioides sp. LHG3406-4]|uniref:VOC family protein n=1 Tax=Nocardioides sp. LHG3406-4 TaxID=2804575 RepID=UPI003CFA900C
MITAGFTAGQINLFADEVQPSVDFYTQACGFTETFRTPEDGPPDHVEMTLGGLKLGVARRAAGAAMHGLDLVAGPAQCDVTLWCADADAAYAGLVGWGATPVREPHDFGSNRAGWLRDPAGHLVSVVAKTS